MLSECDPGAVGAGKGGVCGVRGQWQEATPPAEGICKK